MKKIAFLGYDFFYTCLRAAIDGGLDFKWLFTPECDNVYNFNEKVIKEANQNNAKIKFTKITTEDIEQLIAEGCDLIVSAAYPYKIPVVNHMPKCINIHPTLLPDGRGAWPLPWVILKELAVSGVSIHKVNKDFDAGDLIIQEAFNVDPDENLETLSCKSQLLAEKLLRLLLNDFENYWNNSKIQGSGSYWPMPTFEDRELNWNLSIKEIDKISRAFSKFDSIAKFDEKEWIVQDLSTWKQQHSFKPGSVVHYTNKEVVIAAKDGFVCLRHYTIDPDFVN